MTIGLSLLLAAAGAILIWAVNAEVSGVDLDVVGWVLLIIGVVGAAIGLLLYGSYGDRDSRRLPPDEL